MSGLSEPFANVLAMSSRVMFVVGVLGLAGVGLGLHFGFRDPPSAQYPTVTALFADLADKGAPCRTVSVTENDTEGIDAVGSCADPSQEFFVWVFDDPGRSTDEIRWDFKPLRTNRPPAPEIFVVGANWIVKTMSPATAEDVQQLLGGEIHR